jgi:hypothetical protein
MLRTSMMALAALLFAAAMTVVPRNALAGWYGPHWDYYGGRFVVSAPSYLHSYRAFNPSCVWLRRVVPTPLGPQWQLVPVCV